jgi:hypothetical protein
MRITIKPPSPAPSPPLPAGALVTLRVEAADPVPRIDGPVSIAYEGRYADDPSPAFLFPAPGNGHEKEGVSTATSAASDFRTPVAAPSSPHVDIPAHEGDVVTATLLADNKTYSAALRAPAAPDHPNQAPVVLQLAEGGAAPPPGPPPTPQPAPGLTITPDDPDDPDVLTLDPAPGNDNIVVVG